MTKGHFSLQDVLITPFLLFRWTFKGGKSLENVLQVKTFLHYVPPLKVQWGKKNKSQVHPGHENILIFIIYI